MQSTYAFVFARGGSKGLPRKNILPIGGLPMLAHGIRLAKQLDQVHRIFISTDCDEIASIGQLYGAEVIHRPLELASDTASEWLAWQHAINHVTQNFGPFDRFLSLPATAPLRGPEDVINCLNALEKKVDIVISMTPSQRSPWFNMVRSDERNIVSLVVGDRVLTRRQDSQTCFDMTTVAYVSRPSFILNSSSMWEGVVRGVEVPRERAIDIDDELDYMIARFLMEKHAKY